MTLTLFKVAFVYRKIGSQLSIAVVLPFEYLSDIFLIGLNNNKLSVLPSLCKSADKDSIILEIYLCALTVFFLILKLSIVQLFFLMEYQKPFVLGLPLFIGVSEVGAVFVFFDKRKRYFHAA